MQENQENDYRFSICTLVHNRKKYNALYNSLLCQGFVNDEDEIITLDNSQNNSYDCYQAVKEFLRLGRNQFIIIVHDDVIFNCDRSSLVAELKRAFSANQNIAVLGIAGTSKSPYNAFGHFISYRGEEQWGIPKDELIESLDECFLIIKKTTGVCVSENLHGFHFYGSDICINAKKSGYSCAIIDFLITHLSPGNLNEDFLKSRLLFEKHLKNIGYKKTIITTCTAVYGGDSFFHQARSIAIAIFKPHVGNHSDAPFVRKKLHEMVHQDRKLSLVISFLTLFIESKNLSLYLCKRIPSELLWWRKNWKSRFKVYLQKLHPY